MKPIPRNQVPDFLEFKEFCEWYLLSGPFFSPRGSSLKSVEIAPGFQETIIFQHKTYQVELYHVGFAFPTHQHPTVSTLHYNLVPGFVPDINSLRILEPGTVRENNTPYSGEPFFKLVLQQWPLGAAQDSISVTDYIGPAISENHLNLVRAKNPAWVTADNQIDTTK